MTCVKVCFLVLVSVAFEIGVTAESTAVPIVTECKDALDTCGLLDTSYYCVGLFRNWAIQNCQQTCKLCGQKVKPTISTSTSKQTKSTSTTTHGPISGMCYGNGHYYNEGETWHVGCYSTCNCTDARLGHTSCRGRCLTWHNLPSICSLEDAPPGLCCRQPMCPSSVVVTVPHGFEEQYPGYQVAETIVG